MGSACGSRLPARSTTDEPEETPGGGEPPPRLAPPAGVPVRLPQRPRVGAPAGVRRRPEVAAPAVFDEALAEEGPPDLGRHVPAPRAAVLDDRDELPGLGGGQ